MMLEYLTRQIFHTPVLMEEGALLSVTRLFESKILTGEFLREGKDPCGKAVQLHGMEKVGGFAHVPIAGVMGQKFGGFAKGSGAVDDADIRAEVEDAVADKSIHTILFDMDSPGGMAMGAPEMASFVESIPKRKIAFTNGIMASRAFWFASACDGIYATPSAMIGSIGAVMAIEDHSERARAMGVKVEVFRSGDLKGIGIPGTSLSDSQKIFLMERVMKLHDMFVDGVLKHRPLIPSSAMRGQSFLASEARDLGLIDGIVSSKFELVQRLRR